MAELCRLSFENTGTDFRGEVAQGHAPVPTGNGRLNPAEPAYQAEGDATREEQEQKGSGSGRRQSQAERIGDCRREQPQSDARGLRVDVLTPACTQQMETHRRADEVIQS